MKKKRGDLSYFIEDIIYTFLRIVVLILITSISIICIYETPDIYTWNDATESYTCVMENFYINEGDDTEDIEILNRFVETLPPVFIKEFKNNWRVIVEDYIPQNFEYANNIIIGGYTDWDSRIIFIRKQEDIVDTLDIFSHEIGHCFDFEYGSVSYSKVFIEIYDLYKECFTEQYTNSPVGYSTSSTTEFFAACFKEYLLYPEHLNMVAPEAYKFVDSFYKGIQKIEYVYIYDLGAVANTILRLAEI